MGAVYRHTTAETEASVVLAPDVRLATVRGVLDGLGDGMYTG
jgi:hypothetical protein